MMEEKNDSICIKLYQLASHDVGGATPAHVFLQTHFQPPLLI